MAGNFDDSNMMQTAQNFGASQGSALHQGVQLAAAAQDMQQKQLQTQQMQDQLDMSKANALIQRLTTQNRIGDDRLRQSYAKQNDAWAAKNGLAYEGFFTDHSSSDAQTRLAPLMQLAQQAGQTPEQARAFVATLQSPADVDQATQNLQAQIEQQNKKAIAQMEVQGKKEVAQIGATGRVEAAGVTGGQRAIRNVLQANNAYSKEIGPSENAMLQANRASGLIDKIQTGDLKSTKTLAADLEAAQASLLGGGRPSTVYGQQAVHMDDIYSRAQNAIQFLTSTPQDTQSPAKLEQLKLDVKALKDFYDEQHQQKYTSFRQGIPEQIRTGIDNRYNTFRKVQNLSPGLADTGGMPQPQAPVTAGQAPQGGVPQAVIDGMMKLPGMTTKKLQLIIKQKMGGQ